MKKFFSSILVAVIVMGCGKSEGGSSRSGLTKNQYLGLLPAICADYQSDLEAIEKAYKEKEEKLMAGGKGNLAKIMALEMQAEKDEKAREAKFMADYKAEWNKVKGRDIPFSLSEALQNSSKLFFDLVSVKLSNQEDQLSIFFKAKRDFKVAFKLYGIDKSDYTIPLKFIASDGSVLFAYHDIFLYAQWTGNEFFAAGQVWPEKELLILVNNAPEKWADFAGIEFITTDEYFQIDK